MTIAQSTTIQAYQLRKGGTPARMVILRLMAESQRGCPQRMIAADSANNRNSYTRLQQGDWRDARKWTMKNYAAAYCSGINQGFYGVGHARSAVWYSHQGEQFRNERDACEVLHMRHTGWYTDSYQDDTAVGIVASLPHGRFIAGYRWTGNDERVYFDDVFTDEGDAARMADEHARVFAENCRDNEEIEDEE